MARDATKSKAAYTLVDLSDLPADVRQEVMEDALAGGGEYGVRVVEEVHNGAARAQIFGYYHADQEKWDEAKKELGITGSEVEDGEVTGEAGEDPRAQAALRQAAEQRASAEADAIRTAEDESVRQVLEGESNVPANSPNRQQPNSNIADATVSTPSKHERPVNKAKGK